MNTAAGTNHTDLLILLTLCTCLTTGCAELALPLTSIADAGAEVEMLGSAKGDDPLTQPEFHADAAIPEQVSESEDVIEGRGLPCTVERIMDQFCVSCHDHEPKYGAPMPLVNWGDLHGTWPTPGQIVQKHGGNGGANNAGRHIYELVVEAVQNRESMMPPQPNPRLSAADIDTLITWANAEAPSGVGCEEGSLPPAGGIPEVADDMIEDECEFVMELRAHGQSIAGDETPYAVPQKSDHYECFYFRLPWNEPAHGLRFDPIVDDSRVLHHWLLYKTDSGNESDGFHAGCGGVHEGSELVAGWAPGGEPLIMPEGVGMKLPEGPSGLFVLEVHYNNAAGHQDALDRSGVKICATTALREETAGMQWLGTENLFMLAPGQHDRSGWCRPNLSQPVTILNSSPHMHRRGRHLKSIVHRQGGGTDTLIDEPFDFDHQVIYETPMVIYPGDRIETTCTFENEPGLAHFGPGTDHEMCYNFVVAYPYGALSTGGSLTQASNACLR